VCPGTGDDFDPTFSILRVTVQLTNFPSYCDLRALYTTPQYQTPLKSAETSPIVPQTAITTSTSSATTMTFELIELKYPS